MRVLGRCNPDRFVIRSSSKPLRLRLRQVTMLFKGVEGKD